MSRSQGSSRRSREQRHLRPSKRTRDRTAKHNKGRTSRDKPTSKPIAENVSVDDKLSQLVATVGSLVLAIQKTREDNKAIKARVDGMQEKSVKSNPFLSAEPATFIKDRFTDPGPLPENVEPSDSDDESGHSSARSHRPRRNRKYSRHHVSGAVRKCPELSPEDIGNSVVVHAWILLVKQWAPLAAFYLPEFIRVLKLAFGENCEPMLKTANISDRHGDPDDVQRILTCTNPDEFSALVSIESRIWRRRAKTDPSKSWWYCSYSSRNHDRCGHVRRLTDPEA